MRFLAPPAPSCTVGSTASAAGVAPCSASANNGSALFDSTGCSVCHIRSMQTGNFATVALQNQQANLFSDLLVHNMDNWVMESRRVLQAPTSFGRRRFGAWGNDSTFYMTAGPLTCSLQLRLMLPAVATPPRKQVRSFRTSMGSQLHRSRTC